MSGPERVIDEDNRDSWVEYLNFPSLNGGIGSELKGLDWMPRLLAREGKEEAILVERGAGLSLAISRYWRG